MFEAIHAYAMPGGQSLPARDMPNEGSCMSFHPLRERGKRLTFFGQLLEGNFRKIRLGICMFNGHPHQLAVFIQVNQDVFIDIFSLRHFLITEYDLGGIRIRKIFHLHFGLLKDRSKNAL